MLTSGHCAQRTCCQLSMCCAAAHDLPVITTPHHTTMFSHPGLCMQIVVACIKVASQAVSTMPSLFFFPILPFIMTVCLIVYWVVVAGYLYSAGTIVAKTTSGSAATALTISVSSSA